ncbi:MAG: right-handed parallel beta-helix repeat-containing protein [Phaeodactylibacter sp.]|nr:right-handed parallel beta-helix repeat-containing protein [Phaeodactylibacter sp.]
MRYTFFLLLLVLGCQVPDRSLILESGLVITQSIVFSGDTLRMPTPKDMHPAILVEGEDIVIDFKGALIQTEAAPERPNKFEGLAIKIQNSKNIRLRNLNVRGFKVGIWAESVEHLVLENCDISYNYRPQLKSSIYKPAAEDRVSNIQDVIHNGAAIYLKNCKHFELDSITCLHGQNGIILEDGEAGKIMHSLVQFNSGIGIGLLNTKKVEVAHNAISWNSRGYNYGLFNYPQGAGALLLDSLSKNNQIYYNDLSHSGILMPVPQDSSIVYRGNTFQHNNWLFAQPAGKFQVSPFLELADSLRLPAPVKPVRALLPPERFQGELYVLQDEWGPYDFQYPSIWLRHIDQDDQWTFLVAGPPGNYKVTGGYGWQHVNPKSGTLPATLFATAKPGADSVRLELEFIGEASIDRFGTPWNRGATIRFIFSETKVDSLHQALLNGKFH